MSISLLVIGMTLSNFTFIGRSTVSLGNYSDFTNQSGVFLETIARDLRNARNVEEMTPDQLGLLLVDPDGAQYKVTYSYSANDRTVVRQEGESNRRLLSDLDEAVFEYWGVSGKATNTREIKEVGVKAKMSRKVMLLSNSNHVVSARFILRNKAG